MRESIKYTFSPAEPTLTSLHVHDVPGVVRLPFGDKAIPEHVGEFIDRLSRPTIDGLSCLGGVDLEPVETLHATRRLRIYVRRESDWAEIDHLVLRFLPVLSGEELGVTNGQFDIRYGKPFVSPNADQRDKQIAELLRDWLVNP